MLTFVNKGGVEVDRPDININKRDSYGFHQFYLINISRVSNKCSSKNVNSVIEGSDQEALMVT